MSVKFTICDISYLSSFSVKFLCEIGHIPLMMAAEEGLDKTIHPLMSVYVHSRFKRNLRCLVMDQI